MYRLLFAAIIALSALGASAEPSASARKLGEQVVELLQVRSMFGAYLKQCTQPEGSYFDPKHVHATDPGSFGGISPQSAYWPEVEAIYRGYQRETCTYLTAEEFAKFYAEQYATQNSEEDLRAAVAFFSSPAGTRFTRGSVKVNEAFQGFANEQIGLAYQKASAQVGAEMRALIRRYKKEAK